MFVTKPKTKQNLSRFEFLHEKLDHPGMCSAGMRGGMNSALKGQFHMHWNHMQSSQGSKLKPFKLLEKQLPQFSVTLVNQL